MKFKSPIFSAVSGSVGGATYARNAGGMYVRARATPVNPQSLEQTAIRNALTVLTTRWASVLTQDERDAWAVYAANVPLTDTLGDARNRSGQQQFLRSNVSRLQAGLAIADTAPTTFDLGSFTPVTSYGAGEAASPNSNFTIDPDDDWANETGSAMLVYVSRPQSPGINFFKGPYRLATTVLGDDSTAPIPPVDFDAPFAIVEGQKLFGYVRVTRADGRLSGIQSINAIVGT